MGSPDSQSADNRPVKKYKETLRFLAGRHHGTAHAHVLRRFYRIYGKSGEDMA